MRSGVLDFTLNCNALGFSEAKACRVRLLSERKLLINPWAEARRQCSVNRKDCDWEWRSLDVVNSDSQTLSTSDIEYIGHQEWWSLLVSSNTGIDQD